MNEATKKLIQLLVVEDYLVFHESKSLLQKILDKEITNYLDIYYELVDFPNQERDWYHLLDDVGALEMYQEIIADDCFLDEVVEENDDYDQFYLKLIDSVSFRQEENKKELFCKDFSSFLEQFLIYLDFKEIDEKLILNVLNMYQETYGLYPLNINDFSLYGHSSQAERCVLEFRQKEETDIIQLLFYDDCFHVTHLFSMFSDKDNKKGYSYFNKDELKDVQFNLFFYDDWVNGRYLDVDVDGEKVLLDKDNYVRAEDLPQPWLDNFQMIFNELGDGKPINSVLEEFVPGSLKKFLLKTKTLKGLS